MANILIISTYDSSYFWSVRELVNGKEFYIDRNDMTYNEDITNNPCLPLYEAVEQDNICLMLLIINESEYYKKFDYIIHSSDGMTEFWKGGEKTNG